MLSAVGADKSASIHDTCLRCHDRTATSPNHGFDPAKNSCASCHAAGSYDAVTTCTAAPAALLMAPTPFTTPPIWRRRATRAVYAGGQACSSCHSAALKTAHTASSAGNVTCAGCHNDTALGSATQVKASWTNDQCTDCHTAASVHTAFETAGGTAATHRPPPLLGCGASGVGCHTTCDLRRCTRPHPGGCATCHAPDKDMSAVSKTCGQATGCHATNAFHAGISGNDTTHTATAMSAVVDNGNGYTGNACTDCHTSNLKSSHDKAGPTSNLGWTSECTDCHNSTAPINGSAVVQSNWTPKYCARRVTRRATTPTRPVIPVRRQVPTPARAATPTTRWTCA